MARGVSQASFKCIADNPPASVALLPSPKLLQVRQPIKHRSCSHGPVKMTWNAVIGEKGLSLDWAGPATWNVARTFSADAQLRDNYESFCCSAKACSVAGKRCSGSRRVARWCQTLPEITVFNKNLPTVIGNIFGANILPFFEIPIVIYEMNTETSDRKYSSTLIVVHLLRMHQIPSPPSFTFTITFTIIHNQGRPRQASIFTPPLHVTIKLGPEVVVTFLVETIT